MNIEAPHAVWKAMSKRDVRQLIIAVFFLFATIGPLTLLMDESIIQASWIKLVFMTILCGSFSASIVINIGSPIKIIIGSVIYCAIIISISIFDPVFLHPDVPPITINSETAFQLSNDQISDIKIKRVAFGMTAILCITVGYTLFIQSIGRENKRRAFVEAEMKFAQSIHQSLLPKLTTAYSWNTISGASISASKIGGDYFDVIEISKTKILTLVADASGHGMGAGILSAMVKSAILQAIQQTDSIADLLNRVNKTVHSVTEKNMFVTCAIALFDYEKQTATLATAGHPPILRLNADNNAVEEFRMQNLALGIQQNSAFQETTIPLNFGDTFLLITDGLTETTNSINEQYGMDRIKKYFANNVVVQKGGSNELLETAKKYSGKTEFEDDATALIIKINGK